MTDHVTLIGGLRYANDDKDFEETYPVYSMLTPNSILPFRRPDDFLRVEPPDHRCGH